jgi:hypothetical protein
MGKKKGAEDEKRITTDSEQRQIIADPKDLKGSYCNAANFRHTRHEFIMDFIFHLGNEAHFLSRIISNPLHAKAMLKALGDNIKEYEKKFGPIPSGDSGAAMTKH